MAVNVAYPTSCLVHATGGVTPSVTLGQQIRCPTVGLHRKGEQGGSLEVADHQDVSMVFESGSAGQSSW